MSFSFFKPSRPKTPLELVKAVRESLLALDAKTVAEVKALEKVLSRYFIRSTFPGFPLRPYDGQICCIARLVHLEGSIFCRNADEHRSVLEEVERSICALRTMISGDGEVEPNPDQLSQLAVEICKEGVLDLFIHKLPVLGWEARKDLVHCWCILLRQKVGSNYCCLDYIQNHMDLLDSLVTCYDNKDIALNCGNMLRECIKFPSLAQYILESTSFELFFKYVELPTFDVATDAFSTFKDLLTKHELAVSEFLSSHYEQLTIFFELYERLLTSTNYVTRRQSLKLLSEFLLEPPNSQSMKRYILEVRYLKVMMTLLKDSSKNIQISAFHIFKVFVANPNKPPEIMAILAKNNERLITLLNNLPLSKGSEDEQLEEEKEMIVKEIKRISHIPGIIS